jgi:hypothetical protein
MKMRVAMLFLWVAGAMLPVAMPANAAQMQTVDPNSAIDADLAQPRQTPRQAEPSQDYSTADSEPLPSDDVPPPAYAPPPATRAPGGPPSAAATTNAADTYKREDLIGAAEGVFGRGAEGLAGIIENILKDQGEPNAYIAGREASGAFVVGLRYGSGMLSHKVEGQREVYWTGPSVGFDVGGDANKVFVLVYNLYDSQDLYKRFPAGEGRVYFVGGFSASYMRRGDVVLIPVRLGVGWRLGANVGYMNFTEKSRWLPF